MVQNLRNELIRPGKSTRRTEALYDMAEAIAPAILFVAVLFTFVVRYAGVDGSSMLPTLENGQKLVTTAFLFHPERGDIVVLSDANGHGKPLVKRVIAVAGDEVDLLDGRVLINGAPTDEPYLAEGMMTYPASETQNDLTFPVRVPEGCVFVMGDNRTGSSDSRRSAVGFVRADDILGKVIFRIHPFFETEPFHFTYRVE